MRQRIDLSKYLISNLRTADKNKAITFSDSQKKLMLYNPSTGKKSIIIHGPARSGKTFGIAYALIYWATQLPQFKCLLCAKSLAQVRGTLKKAIIEVCKIKKIPYQEFNQSGLEFVVLPNSNSIFLCTGYNHKVIHSKMGEEYGTIVVDEARDATYDDYGKLRSRLSMPANPRLLVLITNPEDEFHWINQDLIINKKAEEFFFPLEENLHNLSPDYVEGLMSLPAHQYLRIARGIWSSAKGQVIDNIGKLPQSNYSSTSIIRNYCSIDVGHSHDTAFVKLGWTNRYKFLLLEDYSAVGGSVRKHFKIIDTLCLDNQQHWFYLDNQLGMAIEYKQWMDIINEKLQFKKYRVFPVWKRKRTERFLNIRRLIAGGYMLRQRGCCHDTVCQMAACNWDPKTDEPEKTDVPKERDEEVPLARRDDLRDAWVGAVTGAIRHSAVRKKLKLTNLIIN